MDLEKFNEIESFCKETCQIGYDEDLAKLIAGDNLIVHNLGITHHQIISMLTRIINHHEHFSTDTSFEYLNKTLDKFSKLKILNGFKIVNIKTNFILSKFNVIGIKWDKTFVCGFDVNHEVETTDYIIIKENEDWLHVDCLQLHQIDEHHFFQGKKSLRRLDPEYIIKFLDIKPNVCYETKFNEYYIWKLNSYCEGFTFAEFNSFEDDRIIESFRGEKYEAKLIVSGGDQKLLLHVLNPNFTGEYIDLFGGRAYTLSSSHLKKKSGTYYYIGKMYKKELHKDEIIASEKYTC